MYKLYGQPIVNANVFSKGTGFSNMGAQKIIDRFIDIGILRVKDKDVKYGKAYMYREYLEMFVDREKD